MKIRCLPAKVLIIFALIFSFPLSCFAQKPIEALPDTQDNLEMIMKEGGMNPLGEGGVAESGLSLRDHRAVVAGFEGKVRILKAGTPQWVPVERNMIIEEGDQILTSEASRVDIAYDAGFMNIARIEERTKAEFRTIEPTDLYMEDGTVFSALDGLPSGVNYQVSTPTAVAAVRGTHLATLVSGGVFTDIAVTQDAKEYVSRVEVTDHTSGKTLSVMENSQATFTSEGPQLGPVSPEIQNLADAAKAALAELEKLSMPVGPEPVETQNLSDETTEDAAAVKEEELAGDDKPAGDGGGPDDGGMRESGAGSPAEAALFSEAVPEGSAENEAEIPPETKQRETQLPDSAVDALMDNLIPPEDFTPVDGNGNQISRLQNTGAVSGKSEAGLSSEKETPAAGEQTQDAAENPAGTNREGLPEVDAGALGEFFRVGMGDQFDPETLSDTKGVAVLATNVMENLGFDQQFSRQFGDVMGKFAELSGDFNTFMSDARGTDDLSSVPIAGANLEPARFEKMLEGGFPDQTTDMKIDLQRMGIATDQLVVDPNEFARIAIDNNLLTSQIVTDIAKDIFVTANPYYETVLEGLEKYLTLTNKSLLTSQSLSQIYEPFIEHNVDQDIAGEKIFGVTYFAQGDDVHAQYDYIQDDNHSDILQPSGTTPYTIIDVHACNTNDSESGGVCG